MFEGAAAQGAAQADDARSGQRNGVPGDHEPATLRPSVDVRVRHLQAPDALAPGFDIGTPRADAIRAGRIAPGAGWAGQQAGCKARGQSLARTRVLEGPGDSAQTKGKGCTERSQRCRMPEESRAFSSAAFSRPGHCVAGRRSSVFPR